MAQNPTVVRLYRFYTRRWTSLRLRSSTFHLQLWRSVRPTSTDIHMQVHTHWKLRIYVMHFKLSWVSSVVQHVIHIHATISQLIGFLRKWIINNLKINKSNNLFCHFLGQIFQTFVGSGLFKYGILCCLLSNTEYFWILCYWLDRTWHLKVSLWALSFFSPFWKHNQFIEKLIFFYLLCAIFCFVMVLFLSRQQESRYYSENGRNPNRSPRQSERSSSTRLFESPPPPLWTKHWRSLCCVQLGALSPSDCQHTGKRAACFLHLPLPRDWVHLQGWMDKRRSIVSVFFKRLKSRLLLKVIPGVSVRAPPPPPPLITTVPLCVCVCVCQCVGGHDGPTTAASPVGLPASSALHPCTSGWGQQTAEPGGPGRLGAALHRLRGDQRHLDQREAQHHHTSLHLPTLKQNGFPVQFSPHNRIIITVLFVLQVHDIFHPFIQTSDDEITFLTVNESKTGFCHLYKITSVLQRGSYHWAKGYTHSEGKTVEKHELSLIVEVYRTNERDAIKYKTHYFSPQHVQVLRMIVESSYENPVPSVWPLAWHVCFSAIRWFQVSS